MFRRAGIALLLALAALTAALPSSAGPAATGAPKWKPDGRVHVRIRGLVSTITGRTAQVGNVVVLPGAEAIGNSPRHGLAAFDLRAGKFLPFDPRLPAGSGALWLTASATTVYAIVDGPTPKVEAFALRTSKRLSGFDSTAVDAVQPSAIAYADGKLIATGPGTYNPDGGPSYNLGAFDARTGAPLWQRNLGWFGEDIGTGLLSDGRKVYVGTPLQSSLPPIAAFSLADGSVIPGWGSSLRGYKHTQGVVSGFSGSKVLGGAASDSAYYTLVVSKEDGRPVVLPRLPISHVAELFYGTGRTIVGRWRAGYLYQYAVYADPSGRLLGLIRFRYTPLAQRDDRHLLVTQILPDQTHELILELVPPKG